MSLNTLTKKQLRSLMATCSCMHEILIQLGYTDKDGPTYTAEEVQSLRDLLIQMKGATQPEFTWLRSVPWCSVSPFAVNTNLLEERTKHS